MTVEIRESWSQMLQVRIGELEQECNYLRDKCAELLDGKLTLCANPSCNRFLGPRLAMGYATCSEGCTKDLHRALLGRYAPLPTQRKRLPNGHGAVASTGRG